MANVNTAGMMDERELNALADEMLARIERLIEACEADIDFELLPGGVIEVEFANGSKIVINRHVAAREIWVAAKSGGYHFRPEGGRWIATRDGAELLSLLSRCISEQSGERVELGDPG